MAVLRALQLGDMLCAVPALRALRAGLPNAHIALVGLPWAREFAGRFLDYIDEYIEFPGYPGMPEREADIHRIPQFLREMQDRRFDLSLQLHGSGVLSNGIALLFGAAETAGFYPASGVCPDETRFMPYPDDQPERLRLLRLITFLGCPSCGDQLEFPIVGSDRDALAVLPEAVELTTHRYACIHPGARHPARRWPPERFAAVADELAEAGLRIVLTGTEAERPVVQAVRTHMHAPALDFTGRTNLGSLAALLSSSLLLVSNDTGVSHLADALRVPSVIVFTGSDPGRWAPADSATHRVLRGVGISVDEVVMHAMELLEREVAHAG